MKKRFSIAQTLLLMALAASVTLVVTYYATEERIASRLSAVTEAQQVFSKLNEVKRCVDKNYVGDYDAASLSAGAVEGFIQSLGDRWSYYLTREEYQTMNGEYAKGYTGIGVRTGYDSDTGAMQIAEVYAGSPAAGAGLLAGDVVLSVDGSLVADVGYESAKALMQGDIGSTLTLRILRNGQETEITAVRAYVRQQSVFSALLEKETGYVRIKEFSKGTDEDFAGEISKMTEKGARRFIIDLRDNGGGDVDVFLDTLRRVLPEGVIFITEDKNGVREEFNSNTVGMSYPLAVLVNKNSYGVAEYFAAVLQEYGKAVVVGEQTVGKGYGQTTVELSDGSALVLSNVRYFTPKLRSLTGIGCVPDHAVALQDASVLANNVADPARDAQLAKAVEILGTL